MVSINLRLLVYFKSWQNRVRVDDHVLIDGFGYYFRVPWGCMKQRSVWWRFCALQNWQKRFVCSGLGLKIFIINAIDQGVLAASKPLAVNNVPIWTTLMACSPDADHWRNSHHILHVWRNQGNSKTRLVHQRYLHEVLYHIYGGGGGGAGWCPPPPTIQTSINFSRLWGAVVSWLVFNKWLSNLAIF